MEAVNKAKNWCKEHKKEIKKVGVVFGIELACMFASYACGYKNGSKKGKYYETGLTMMTLADPTLLDHLDSAAKKTKQVLEKI